MDDSDCNLDDSICSEYSDSDDVPPVDRYGRRVWDYFYIIKADLIKGLDEISCIYKKKSKMYGDLYQLFDRVPSSRLIKCCETRCYVSFKQFSASKIQALAEICQIQQRIFFDEEELVRVQCKYIGRKKWFVVELMNVDITEADPANLLLQQHLSQLKL